MGARTTPVESESDAISTQKRFPLRLSLGVESFVEARNDPLEQPSDVFIEVALAG
jgi:hypothetical protein